MSQGGAFKVVFLGEGRVGKTSIGKRWVEGSFEAGVRSTVAAALYQKTAHTESGKPIPIHLWDTAGQEEFKSLAPIYYKDSQCAILVYSCIDQGSFEKAKAWRQELVNARGEDIKIALAANKVDLGSQRCVSKAEGESYAQSVGARHFDVSAKSGQGIDMLFFHVADLLASLPKRAQGPKKSGRVALTVVEGEQKKKGCC